MIQKKHQFARGGKSLVFLPYRDGKDEPVWQALFDGALKNTARVREIGEVLGSVSQVTWQHLLEL